MQNTYNNLAIAYAQARLSRRQSDAEKVPSEDELYAFCYDYLYALDHIEQQIRKYPRA